MELNGMTLMVLITAGWVKDRGITTDEYQAVEAWNRLLMRFSGLQAISGRIPYSRALGILKRLARGQIFQPRTGATPIQVMGLYVHDEEHGRNCTRELAEGVVHVLGLQGDALPEPVIVEPG